MHISRLAWLSGLLVSGCVVVHDHPSGGGPIAPVGSNPPVYSIDPGASTVVYPGQQAGYGISANVGGSYRIVWTGDAPNAYSEFTGTIYTPGRFVSYTPGCGDGSCPLENDDTIQPPAPTGDGGQIISFDTFATDGLDGLDFVVNSVGEPVVFTLQIDGAVYPQLVFFPSGGVISSPDADPFALTTQ